MTRKEINRAIRESEEFIRRAKIVLKNEYFYSDTSNPYGSKYTGALRRQITIH